MLKKRKIHNKKKVVQTTLSVGKYHQITQLLLSKHLDMIRDGDFFV